jgi:hypothetical protein
MIPIPLGELSKAPGAPLSNRLANLLMRFDGLDELDSHEPATLQQLPVAMAIWTGS